MMGKRSCRRLMFGSSAGVALLVGCVISLWILFLFGCNNGKQKTESPAPAGDVYADNIRITPFQTPEAELAGFKVPPGFEVTLFASEPDISKPINMEFDAKGRLWVTNTEEYPMPAKGRKGRDRITILEDTDGDGRADKFTPFIDTLNIPIGVTPVYRGAIAYSIPNIYRFTDTDGDGRADTANKLVGPFEYIDTHGMVNNLIRSYDGWVHACHGYANTSTVAGKDGDSITMSSGNTFRFREDGSRVEATTYGRINPFGYAYDDWGYLYSLDCHTKPIYQLIHGAQYPSQGAKAPSFGWAPEMMSYEFGSTANSGLVLYTGDQYPKEYQHNFYSGNVVTSRINRNTFTLEGSSPVSRKEEDFLVSEDPWFRPVDLKTGPDGSIYVADFYNRIIGHYEVAKDHPGRDRTSGRIWKITYNPSREKKIFHPTDWSHAPLDQLLKALNTPQLNIRMMIANQVVDGFGKQAVQPLLAMMQGGELDTRSFVQGLWILYRLNSLPEEVLATVLQHNDPVVVMHGLRVLAEMKKLSVAQHNLVLAAMDNRSFEVQRMAAEVLGVFPEQKNLPVLLRLYEHAMEKDTHLKYTILLALRNHLRSTMIMRATGSVQWTETQLGILMKVVPEVASETAAAFAFQYLQQHTVPAAQQVIYFGYIGRYIAGNLLDNAIALIRKNISGSIDDQFTIYQTIRQGVAQRGGKVSIVLQEWGTYLAGAVLNHIAPSVAQWKNFPLDTRGESPDPWTVTHNFLPEELEKIPALHSRARGGEPTGRLYSPYFSLPASLQLTIMDYDIDNTENAGAVSKNVVRIRLQNGMIAAENRLKRGALQKKNELNRRVTFDLNQWKGQTGYIEILDSSSTSAIGIANLDTAILRFPVVPPREMAERYQKSIQIAGDLKVSGVVPALEQIVKADWMDYPVRIDAALALMHIDPQKNAAVVATVLSQKDGAAPLRKGLAAAMEQVTDTAVYSVLEGALGGASYDLQVNVAKALAGSPAGIDHFIHALQQQNVPAGIVAEIPVREKLSRHATAVQKKVLEKLTAGGVNDRVVRDQLIAARVKGFESAGGSEQKGHQVFLQNCSMCHQVRGEGGMIGPQLEGIGNWGAKALSEKVLDPNRNISTAFRTYSIVLKNGQTLGGLYRRTEGAVIIFADPAGKEFSVNKNDISENKPTPYTLMPDQFRNTIAEKDFYDLLAFLLNIKNK